MKYNERQILKLISILTILLCFSIKASEKYTNDEMIMILNHLNEGTTMRIIDSIYGHDRNQSETLDLQEWFKTRNYQFSEYDPKPDHWKETISIVNAHLASQINSLHKSSPILIEEYNLGMDLINLSFYESLTEGEIKATFLKYGNNTITTKSKKKLFELLERINRNIFEVIPKLKQHNKTDKFTLPEINLTNQHGKYASAFCEKNQININLELLNHISYKSVVSLSRLLLDEFNDFGEYSHIFTREINPVQLINQFDSFPRITYPDITFDQLANELKGTEHEKMLREIIQKHEIENKSIRKSPNQNVNVLLEAAINNKPSKAFRKFYQKLKSLEMLADEDEFIEEKIETLMGDFIRILILLSTSDLEIERALTFIMAHEAYHVIDNNCETTKENEVNADAFAVQVYLKLFPDKLLRTTYGNDEESITDEQDMFFGNDPEESLDRIFKNTKSYQGDALHPPISERISDIREKLKENSDDFMKLVTETYQKVGLDISELNQIEFDFLSPKEDSDKSDSVDQDALLKTVRKKLYNIDKKDDRTQTILYISVHHNIENYLSNNGNIENDELLKAYQVSNEKSKEAFEEEINVKKYDLDASPSYKGIKIGISKSELFKLLNSSDELSAFEVQGHSGLETADELMIRYNNGDNSELLKVDFLHNFISDFSVTKSIKKIHMVEKSFKSFTNLRGTFLSQTGLTIKPCTDMLSENSRPLQSFQLIDSKNKTAYFGGKNSKSESENKYEILNVYQESFVFSAKKKELVQFCDQTVFYMASDDPYGMFHVPRLYGESDEYSEDYCIVKNIKKNKKYNLKYLNKNIDAKLAADSKHCQNVNISMLYAQFRSGQDPVHGTKIGTLKVDEKGKVSFH